MQREPREIAKLTILMDGVEGVQSPHLITLYFLVALAVLVVKSPKAISQRVQREQRVKTAVFHRALCEFGGKSSSP